MELQELIEKLQKLQEMQERALQSNVIDIKVESFGNGFKTLLFQTTED
jgi:uncharacterized protein (UPF0335 family)